MLTAEKPVRKIHPLILWLTVNEVLVVLFVVKKACQQMCLYPGVDITKLFTFVNGVKLADYILTAGILRFGIILNVLVLLLFKEGRKLLLVLLLSMIAAEVGVRIAEPHFPTTFIEQKGLGARMKPHEPFWRANAAGFNDEEYPKEKSAGTIRILALGDSFNWAGGYSKNYWTLTENELNKKGFKKKIEILNQGTPMIGPKYLFKLMKEEGLLYEPDAVALAIFIGNDFDEQLLENEIVSSRFGYPAPIRSRKKYKIDLKRDSYLAFFLAMKWELFKDSVFKEVEQKAGARVGALSRRRYVEIQKRWSRVGFPDFYQNSQPWEEMKAQLLEYKNYLKNRKVPFYVILLPNELEVSTTLQSDIKKQYPGEALGDLTLPQKMLGEYLGSLGIPYLDLLPEFQLRAQAGDELFIYSDSHYNDAGNALAAEQVTIFLKSQIVAGWRPQP